MECIISIIRGFQYVLYLNRYIYISYLKKYKVNDFIYIKKNIFINYKNQFYLGNPFIKNLIVVAKVIKHLKGNKKIIYKKKRRKGFSKKIGYRSLLTKIKILFIK